MEKADQKYEEKEEQVESQDLGASSESPRVEAMSQCLSPSETAYTGHIEESGWKCSSQVTNWCSQGSQCFKGEELATEPSLWANAS